MSEDILAHKHQAHKHQTHNHAAHGWRIDCGVEVTELSTNKQHTLSCLLPQYLIQSCARGGRRIVEDMCYEIRRAEACVDKSDHHTLVNAGERDSV
jgi:hypothetical protein